jgi:rubrerythrin
MDPIQESAFETAIATETHSLSFYRAVTSKIKNNNTRRVFELLAQEEAGHLDLFCSIYQGKEADLVELLGKNYVNTLFDPYYCSMLDSIDSEKDALQIALKEKQECIDFYTASVETIRDPQLHDVFARILAETHKHCEMISEEYMRLMNIGDSAKDYISVRE